MITASELAGYFAAHAIWCVSEADSLTPILAYTTIDGRREMQRLIAPRPEEAVAFGRKRLAGRCFWELVRLGSHEENHMLYLLQDSACKRMKEPVLPARRPRAGARFESVRHLAWRQNLTGRLACFEY